MELIYTIPGLGTTKDLFKNISIPGHRLKVLDWPEPKAKASLKEYASCFLDQINLTSPINLMGVSFGGMLCCEIAELVPTKKTVIISSCKNSTELPPGIKILKTLPVQKMINDELYRTFASRLSWIVGFEKDYLPEFLTMMRTMPTNYFKYCVDMIINWDKKNNTHPVYHIHGNADTLLPHSFIKNCELIKEGNHAMIVYKAPEINVLLNKFFNGL